MVAQLQQTTAGAAKGTINTSNSTKLSKRIGWLNNHAGLAMQIKYSEVKDLLTGMGDLGAMRLLKELEEKKESVRDPTGYIKVAAQRALGASALLNAALPTVQSMALGVPMNPVGNIAMEATLGRLRKRIGWLNKNANLQSQLVYDKVGQLLAAIGDAQAMEILKKLEEDATKVRDPTGWVTTAARKLLPGNLAGAMASMSGSMPSAVPSQSPVKGVIKTALKQQQAPAPAMNNILLTNQLKKRIGWLNANVPVKEPIQFDGVIAVLTTVGSKQAMEILKHVEENVERINNPTAYIANAARRAAQNALASGTLGQNLTQGVGIVTQQQDENLRNQINWLNSSVGLAAPLSYEKVSGPLLGIPQDAATNILRNLEENAQSVRDPDAWVSNAVKRLQAQPASMAIPGGATDPTDGKLRKRIGWLNSHAGLQGDLRYDKVSPLLAQLPSTQAMEILKTLEESAASVPDPTSWVMTAVQQAAPAIQSFEPAGLGIFTPSESSQIPDPNAEDKIRKRITWMNANVQLALPIQHDKVAGELISLDNRQAMEILKRLEEHAASVRDPTGWVLIAARRKAAGESTSTLMHGDKGAPEDRLRKRITWLNANVALSGPLDYDRLAPLLLSIDVSKAMVLLKNLQENASTVLDPNAYVASAAMHAQEEAGAALLAEQQQQMGESNQMSNDDHAEEVLRNKIAWMNANSPLQAPITFDQVAPALFAVDQSSALGVLAALEESAMTVQDPNAFIVAMSHSCLEAS